MNIPPKPLVAFGIVVSICSAFTEFVPPAMAQAASQGQWKTLSYTMPVNPIHVALMHNGKVLVVSGSGNVPTNKNLRSALWDPQANTITTQPLLWDMFCNGMVVLADGRPFVLGGTTQYDPFLGELRSSAYDPSTNLFTDQQSMQHGRWYPTATVLGDGRVMIFGGTSELGHTNTQVEIYSLSSGWGPAVSAPWTPPLYPRMHLLRDGKVFYSGSTTTSSIFDPAHSTWTMGVAHTNFGVTRSAGTSVLLPLTPGNGYQPRVMIFGGGDPSTATTEIIDLSAANPQWVYGPSMSQPRTQMNATILPNGKVLALGGSLNNEETASASLNADLYDPDPTVNSFSAAGTEAFARLYHSVSLLLPDATVWVAGGNPSRGTYEPHMEIYSPPYLFNADGTAAARPSITNVSSSAVGYGASFTVQTPDAANIANVVLMRNGACTHAFDMDQRYVGLSFTANSGTLAISGPPNGNIAPPGYYMLFILNSAGVPSMAQMIQVSAAPNDHPPAGTITSPSSNVTIQAGQSVPFIGTGSDADGTISGYYWSFLGGNPKTSSLANPGNVIYSTAGSFSASLTVTDNGGLTDPHPPSRTVTIPDFSVAMSPGSRSTTPGNGAAYTVNVIAGASFTANVSFNVAGLPTGASASFSPSTVTASGSSIMTVTTNALTPPGNYSLSLVATSGTLAHTTVASLIVLQSTGTTLIDFGSGFTGTGMQFNGHTKLNGTRLQLTDKTAGNEVASAFWNTPVNVQGFNSDFTFQVTNPVGDGFTFCIQGVGPTAIGQSAGNLGYGGISKSMAVKFDLHSSSGDDGQNATGLYINGTPPTTPSNPLTGGVNLLSGDVFQVQMTYDGTTLAMTVTDVTNPANTSSISWPIDIPTTIGSSTAYAGFTAATGGTTAIQEILGWSYASSTNAVSQPNFSVAISPSSQSITQGGSTTFTATITPTSGVPGDISLSVNGLPTGATSSFAPASLPGAGSSTLTVSTSSTVVTGTYPLTVTASSGSLSHTVTTLLLITQNGVTPTINFGTGFVGGGMQFNGHTKLNGTRLQLTDTTAGSEVASAFWNSPVNVGNFTSDFTFQLTNPNSDGFTFAIQNIGPTAIGPSGSGLGYASILSSVAVKFDLHSNAGEGANSTGLYVNGAVPTLPSTSITGGLNLHSGHILQAHLTYDGATLMLTLTDLTTVPALTFSTSWPINITSTIGSNTAYFGFTAATGGTTATQEVVGWTYSTSLVSQSAATPTFSPPGGSYSSGQAVSLVDTTSGASIFYTLDGSPPNTGVGGSTQSYSTPISVASSETIKAIATAPGFASSIAASAAYVISIPPADFSITASPAWQTVTQGNATTYAASVGAVNGFTGTVTFSVTGLPAGASGSFSPPTVNNSGTSTLTVTTGNDTPASSSTLTITGTSGIVTHSATSTINVQNAGTTSVNFATGFSAVGMKFNGHTKLNGFRLQLTDISTTKQVASAFWTTPVNVQSFTTDFTFQLTSPNADGFTFTIEGVGPTALGLSGSNLGYGGTPGIATSMAVKFDIHNNSGEGINSTGLYINGATPTVPATALAGGVNLHSGDVFQVHMTYNGTTLSMTITDAATPSSTFTTSWPVDIPTIVGANTAYVGFTAGTGSTTATQEILGWTYSNP